MSEAMTPSAGRRELPPVERRGVWIAWGLALQAIGVGIPVTVALRLAHREGVSSGLTHYTIRLVWHEMAASSADVAVVALGVVIFVSGSVVLIRPLVTRRSTLFLAVPAAATAGLAVLGVIALVCAALIALAEGLGVGDWGDLLDNLSSWPRRGRGRRK